MTKLALPALDGRTPLGFLAALGLLRLLTEAQQIDDGGGPPPRLAWSPHDATAVLHDGPETVDAAVAAVTSIIHTIPEGGVLPGIRPNLPPPGEAPDRMRLPREQFRSFAERIWMTDAYPGERWMASLVTDQSVDDKGRVDISLFAAPSGKQSMRTMLEKPLALVSKNPELLREALTGWRRYPGVSGEYLDHKVLFDAADAPDGKPAERGVPGATWLALMSYPLMRTSGLKGERQTTSWQQHGSGAGSRRFVWPLWERPLDSSSASVLLTHPVFDHAQAASRPSDLPAGAQMLSVFWLGHAERRRIPGRTFAGVLTPTRQPWPQPKAQRPTPAARR